MAPPAETETDARRALLGRLIDHAPLFPPASMTMADAVAEDRRVRAGDAGWVVARFVCPASRLDDLGREPVELSIVVDGDATLVPQTDPRVRALEFPLGSEPATGTAAEVYVELVPDGDDLSARIGVLAEHGLRAKVRCGGASVPSVSDLAAFVRSCRERAVPFKATAGLHHPVRRGDEHGFLNLLAAAVFGDEETALAEEDAGAFGLSAEAFSWGGRSAGPDEVSSVRGSLLVAIGSCSAQEPVDELRALGLL